MSIILNKLRVGLNDKRLENQNTLAVMAIMHLLGPTESLLRNNLLKLSRNLDYSNTYVKW